MTERASVNYTFCEIREIHYTLPVFLCDRCQQLAPYFTTASRTAIDVNLDHPVLLHITVTVHHCTFCHHYFRAQPPFLRPDAIYTDQVVDKAVQSVYEDGMAMRRVSTRMSRDFWVRPSEGTIRGWCRIFSARIDFAADYQPWVVSEFSGILCVDEVYQDRLALLLAVDPAAPDGDRLIGYQLIHGPVDASQVEQFLTHLKEADIEPDQVVSDGSQLYPKVLAQVWPHAAHQLCLFHETRHITTAVMKVINGVRKSLPQPPPASGVRGGGPLRNQPPSEDLADAATQRWYWRRLQRQTQIAQVRRLARQGLPRRAIARQTGHHRQTIKGWLQQPIPPLPEDMPEELSTYARLPVQLQRRIKQQTLMHQVHTLAQAGRSYSGIAREVGIHRVTVKRWLERGSLPLEVVEPALMGKAAESVPPPAPWANWEEVKQVREVLQKHRFLLLRRPEHLNDEEQHQVAFLLASPVGPELGVARRFLEDWYGLWRDEVGGRRPLADAQDRYEAWRTNPIYRAVRQLRVVQERMNETKFEPLSQFLRHPEWEATNNGAERGGRAFRHRQGPHFNLRQPEYIENAIKVAAHLGKEAAMQPFPQPLHRCQRGRRRRPEPDTPVIMALSSVSTERAAPRVGAMAV